MWCGSPSPPKILFGVDRLIPENPIPRRAATLPFLCGRHFAESDRQCRPKKHRRKQATRKHFSTISSKFYLNHVTATIQRTMIVYG